MAGSGALMLLVLSTVPTVTKQLSYIASFGVGSIAGMLAMSAAISIPFAFTAIGFEQMNRYIQAGAGLLSLVFGCFLLWQHALSGRQGRLSVLVPSAAKAAARFAALTDGLKTVQTR